MTSRRFCNTLLFLFSLSLIDGSFAGDHCDAFEYFGFYFLRQCPMITDLRCAFSLPGDVVPTGQLNCATGISKAFWNNSQRNRKEFLERFLYLKDDIGFDWWMNMSPGKVGTKGRKVLLKKKRPPVGKLKKKVVKRSKKRATDDEQQILTKLEIPKESLERHDAGASNFFPENARTKVAEERFETRKKRFIERVENTARAELLNQESAGSIVADDGIATSSLTQRDICSAVDVISATKHFDLILDQFGPYRVNYTANGRHMLLGGQRGHVAAFDWMTKHLKNEMNVMETVRDVQWLHVETMYAVAQKRWLRIYDNEGTELHCMKGLFDVKRLEFLPRHMLLVAGSNDSFLHYLDISIGSIVASFRTRRGPLDVMTQNPSNAIVLTGSTKGVVSMWSPNSKEPLVEMLTHRGAVKGVAVDNSGVYMATCGLDKRLKVWDIRNFKELFAYPTRSNFNGIAFSQRKYLAAAVGGEVQIFNDVCTGATRTPYLKHNCGSIVTDLQFCPYEDVLGVGHENGFTSLLVPGAGDPNFDPLRSNPYESKAQRKEREVRMLLDKIQPEMITLDPSDINRVNPRALEETMEYRANVLKIKPPQYTWKNERN